MDIVLAPWLELSEEDHRAKDALSELIYPPGHPDRSVTWARVVPDRQWCVVVREDGALVGYLAIMRREVIADGAPYDTAGIRSVKTHPAYRGRGLATAAMRRAATFIDDVLRPDLSLLWSAPLAVPLYARLGWTPFDGPVYCAQPAGRVDARTLLPSSRFMLRFPGPARTFAEIDLNGEPW